MSSGRNASSSGINTVVGNHIRKRRLALNLTQEELAEMLGLEAFTICRFETGSRAPNLNRIEKLASILQCHISDFFWDHEIPLDSKLRKLERLMETLSPEMQDRVLDIMASVIEAIQKRDVIS